MPFLDLAYQGFGDGLDADGAVVRRFAATPGPLLVASSFSKSFSLYGERVGALTVVAANKDEAGRVLSQVKRVIRSNYSNPPTHGGQIVATILDHAPSCARCGKPSSRTHARPHQADARAAGRDAARARCPTPTSASCSRSAACSRTPGLTKAQVHRLRDEFSIYAIDTGRICVAALNSRNVDYVAEAVAKVVG